MINSSALRRISTKLKTLRKTKGLNLQQMSQQTGLSTSLFSRIENGLIAPSIQTLEAISDYFQVDIEYFFKKEPPKHYSITKEGQRKTLIEINRSAGKGVVCHAESLIEGMEGAFMDPVIITLPENQTNLELIDHLGQELLFVIDGKMELTLGDDKFILKKGDSAYYDATIPHRIVSMSKKAARILSVHLAPGKRT